MVVFFLEQGILPTTHGHKGSEINFLTWSPCGDSTTIFGRQVSISGRQFFFYFSFNNKKAKMHILDISTMKMVYIAENGL